MSNEGCVHMASEGALYAGVCQEMPQEANAFDVFMNYNSYKQYFEKWLDMSDPYDLCVKLIVEFSDIFALKSILSLPEDICEELININEEFNVPNTILNVPLTELVAKYHDRLTQCESIDFQKAFQFVRLSIALIGMKMNSIFLARQSSEYDDDYDDDYGHGKKEAIEAEIHARLKSYIKNVIEIIKPREVTGRFVRPPEYDRTEVKEVLKEVDYTVLIDAYKRLLQKEEEVPVQKKATVKRLKKEVYTVGQKMAEIKKLLSEIHSIRYDKLFEGERDKESYLNTFLAILELLKNQVIIMSTGDELDEIYFHLNDQIIAVEVKTENE